MGFFDALFGNGEDTKKETNNEDADATLRLRKEELNIDKSSVQTGEVELSKEIIEEQKTVDVPLKREEIVIERRTLNNEQSDSPITDEEPIRIPLSEESVNVDKRTVISGEVSAHKRDVEDIKHIDESLKREEARVNKIGNPDVVDDVTDQQYQ